MGAVLRTRILGREKPAEVDALMVKSGPTQSGAVVTTTTARLREPVGGVIVSTGQHSLLLLLVVLLPIMLLLLRNRDSFFRFISSVFSRLLA